MVVRKFFVFFLHAFLIDFAIIRYDTPFCFSSARNAPIIYISVKLDIKVAAFACNFSFGSDTRIVNAPLRQPENVSLQ